MLALAFRSLFSNRARNLFTAFSVMIAMMLVTFVVAAQLRTQDMLSMLKGRNNMLVMARSMRMPRAFQKQIEAVPGVKRVMYMLVPDASSPDKRFKFLLHGTTADYTTIGDAWFHVPPGEVDQWAKERTGALVARQTARDMNLSIGSRVTFDTDFGPIPVVVSGISTKGYKSTGVLVHYDYMTELFPQHKNRVGTFWVELLPGADLKGVATTIDEMFKNTESPTLSVSSSAFVKLSEKAGRVIPSLLTGAGIIILFATLLVTANTIAIGIRERIPQLATLRAIGYRRSRIFRLLLTEVLIVCLAGGLLGALIPLAVFREGVEMSSGQFTLGKVDLPPTVALWVLLLAAALGVLASLIPAWRASRVDIASALRSQA